MAKGGYKGSSPARETSPEEYSGVWDIVEQYDEQKAGSWPFQKDDCAPKSCRFDSGSVTNLTKTFASAGNRRVFTWNFWVKLATLSENNIAVVGSGSTNSIRFNTNGTLQIKACGGNLTTSAVFRDFSAWYAITVSVNSTATIATDRIKLFVNGKDFTSDLTGTNATLNGEADWNTAATHYIGKQQHNNSNMLDGLLSELTFIDGQALSCEEFGFFDGQGIWQPKRFTGDYSSGPVYSNAVPTADGFRSGRLPHHGFDGDLTSYVALNNTTFNLDVGSWGLSGTLEVYTGSNHQYAVNGGSASNMTASGWTNVGDASSITTLTFTRTDGNYPYFNAIRLDGVTLIDAAVGRNSFHLDFSDGVKDQSGLGNDWSALNLNLGGDFTYSSAHGSNVTTAEFAKMVDSDLNTYGEPSGDFVGFAFAGEKITFKIQNTAPDAKAFYIQPATNTSFNFVNGGTWSVSGGSASGNQWTLNANTTETGTFTVPSNYVGTGRIYFSGNSSDFRIYDISPASDTASTQDILVDSPVNGNEASTGAGNERRGNYCTMNALKNSLALSKGNLKVTGTSGWKGSTGTIGMSSGSWYWEYGEVVSNEHIIGIVKASVENPASTVSTTDAYGYGSETGGKYDPVGGSNQSYGSAWTTGDTIGVAFDADQGNLYFYKNGTIQNSGNPAFTGLTDGPYVPSVVQNGSSRSAVLNFGQRPFKYQNAGTNRPSTDYKPLSTSFLPEATIKRGDEAFDVALWTGNGASQTVRYPRLNPDLIWVKERTDTSDHGWWNTLSGVSKYLSSNLTDDEFNTTTEMTSLNEDGFTVGSSGMTNESSQDYVGWAWAAGEATTTIGAGGSNSLAYDQSQTWSSSLTSTQTFNLATTRAFDGDLTTLAATGNATTANILFTKTFTGVTKLRVYMDHDYQNYRVRINGGTWHTDSTLGATANAGWRDLTSIIPANGTVNSIESDTGGQNNGVNWSAVEVNGRLLINSGVTGLTNVPAVECKVRANRAAGFSIIKVDNPTATEGRVHGLSQAPEMIICKSTGASDSWHTYWKLLGRGFYINLNGSSGKAASDQFGSQEANDTSFYVKPVTGSGANKAGGMLYFAWHSVEGFSKFGEYTANNNASGPFVYCGFKPKLVLIWCHTGNEGRAMYDTERHPDNFNGKFLRAGDNNQEPSSNTESFAIDILSNGFKTRGQWGGINETNTTTKYLFAAWAEEPFQSNCRAR